MSSPETSKPLATLRVTFQVDDVHSGARVWSRTVSPILESINTAAAEAEVAGHAAALLSEAILEAERAPFFRRRPHEDDLGLRPAGFYNPQQTGPGRGRAMLRRFSRCIQR
jgi:hypothetical protein